MNPTKEDQVFTLRRMRDVPRLAGFFKTRPYSDAEHCYYTGMLFEDIAYADGVPVTKEEIYWVYRHDAFEVLTGDLLYPAKNTNRATQSFWESIELEIAERNPALAPFTDYEATRWFQPVSLALFKDCDSLELLMFCEEEKSRGNLLLNADGSSVIDVMLKALLHTPFMSIQHIVERVK